MAEKRERYRVFLFRLAFMATFANKTKKKKKTWWTAQVSGQGYKKKNQQILNIFISVQVTQRQICIPLSQQEKERKYSFSQWRMELVHR